jgi:uncharacterized protein (DUF924 family)
MQFCWIPLKDGEHFSVQELKSQLMTTLTGHSFFEYAEKHFKQLDLQQKNGRLDKGHAAIL